MTTPKDPQAELRKQLETIIWFFEDDYAAGERVWKDKQVEETVDKILALFQAHQQAEKIKFMEDIETGKIPYFEGVVIPKRQQELLTELKTEVGKLFKTHYYGEPQGAAEAALELVVAVINRKIGELNG